MSRLAERRGRPHLPTPGDAPNTCRCGRPLTVPNDMHIDELPGNPASAEEARRLGERDDA